MLSTLKSLVPKWDLLNESHQLVRIANSRSPTIGHPARDDEIDVAGSVATSPRLHFAPPPSFASHNNHASLERCVRAPEIRADLVLAALERWSERRALEATTKGDVRFPLFCPEIEMRGATSHAIPSLVWYRRCEPGVWSRNNNNNHINSKYIYVIEWTIRGNTKQNNSDVLDANDFPEATTCVELIQIGEYRLATSGRTEIHPAKMILVWLVSNWATEHWATTLIDYRIF